MDAGARQSFPTAALSSSLIKECVGPLFVYQLYSCNLYEVMH